MPGRDRFLMFRCRTRFRRRAGGCRASPTGEARRRGARRAVHWLERPQEDAERVNGPERQVDGRHREPCGDASLGRAHHASGLTGAECEASRRTSSGRGRAPGRGRPQSAPAATGSRSRPPPRGEAPMRRFHPTRAARVPRAVVAACAGTTAALVACAAEAAFRDFTPGPGGPVRARVQRRARSSAPRVPCTSVASATVRWRRPATRPTSGSAPSRVPPPSP